MSKTGKLKFGADPEFFAACEESGELSVIPPVLLRSDFGADFEQNGNHPIFKRYGETYVHEDGAAFEMSTPPSEDWRTIFETIHQTKENFGKDVLSKFSDICLPQLFSLPTMNYQVERWAGRGADFHMCTMFGCGADMDVYNLKARSKVVDASKHPFRYAGGHIHVSGLKEIADNPLQAVRSMVLTAGLAATAFTDVPELEKGRLYLYGRPGKFRPQKYPDGSVGIEYRTPSTRWTENFKLAEQIFSWAEIGIKRLLVDNLISEISDDVEKPAIKAILECDQTTAMELLSFIEQRL